MSKKRRAKYFTPKDKLPLKYQNDKYEFRTTNKKTVLVLKSTGEKVIANPKVAGTPKNSTINGQKIYNGEVHKSSRNKMMNEIKDSFEPYIKKIPVITEYPIKIEVEVHDVVFESASKQLWDLDNRTYPYIKAFQDCLKKHNKIIDDNILYITRPPAPIFIPIADTEDRKLVFKIYKEDNEVIINWYKDLDEDILKYKL